MANEEAVQIDEDKLTNQLEKAARKLDGKRRESFVDQHSLCGTCKWAQVTRRASRNNRSIYCSSLTRIVPEDIVECSDYANMTQMSLQQMAGMAIMIGGIKERRPGFKVGDSE